MKFQLKALAAAAALVAAASAHADLALNNSGSSSFAMVAFNTVTQSYYVRDLGYTLNSFLPSSVTTAAGDGGVTGTMTPEAGLNKTWATDATWSTWITGQTLTDIVWTVAAGDSLSTGANGVARALVSLSQTPLNVPTNQGVRNAVGTASGVSGMATVSNNGTTWYSQTGATIINSFTTNNSFGAETLTALGSSAGLYYFSATTQTGSTAVAANKVQFGNSAGFASLTLGTDGALNYALAPAVSAVPLPGAVWLMGAGLAAMGGMVRRRKAAAEA